MTTVIPAEPEQLACRWCGQLHGPRCPIVKALEFGNDGRVTRVEFVTDADAPSPWPYGRTR